MTLLALGAAPVSAAPVLEGDDKGVKISVEEALRTALENNLDLVTLRKDPQIADLNVEVAKAFLDPVVQARGDYSKNKDEETVTSVRESAPGVFSPAVTTLTTTRTPDRGVTVSWVDRLDFGADYAITASAGKNDPSPSRFFFGGLTGTNDFAQQFWRVNLNFNMPLLKGFGKESTTRDILIAKSNSEISSETLNLQAQLVMRDVENAYWDLTAARAALNVANESLHLAHDLLDLNKKKVEVGTLAPIEITQADAGVASREEGVILAETSVGNAEDNLRRLMALPPDDPRWDVPLVPTTEPTFTARQVDLAAATSSALERRPEVINARRRLENSQLDERVAKSDKRHQLDFRASAGVGQNATLNAGQQVDVFEGNPVLLGFRDETDTQPFDWSVALIYTYPLHNRAAKANYAIATLSREQSETDVLNAEQDVRVDVRAAARAVVSGAQRVEAARSATVLQRKKLEAEQKKFDNGMSTSFEVLTFQTDLENAQLSEIRALLDYQKALADLERAQGTLLEARGLELNAGK